MTDPRFYQRTIHKHIIPSTYLGEDRQIRIYLPPGYNELLSYPVIYCQDGEQFFNFGRIATLLTQGILDEGLQPAIVVGVDVQIANRTSEYSPNGTRFGAYSRFFAEELVPWTESNYAVRQDSEERILAGDSLGGTFSLHLALDYRSLFHHVLSFSGAFLQSTQDRLANEPDCSWLNLYMLIGLDETSVETTRGIYDFLEANRITRAILEQKQTKLLYVEKPGKHIWGFWQKELPHALRYFLSSRI
jgi:enterochelin esterase-like enzyme